MAYDQAILRSQLPGGAYTVATLPNATQMLTEPVGILAYTSDAGLYAWNGTTWVPFVPAPLNAATFPYTLTTTDQGSIIYSSSGTNTATIPANSSVAFAVGTVITFINMSSGALTIAITTDTMYLGGAGTTGSRSLAQYGVATAIKMTATTWIITGTGLS